MEATTAVTRLCARCHMPIRLQGIWIDGERFHPKCIPVKSEAHHDIIGQQLDEAPPPTDAELFPAYVEFAARQAVADLKREVGKTKASFMLSKFLEEDNAESH